VGRLLRERLVSGMGHRGRCALLILAGLAVLAVVPLMASDLARVVVPCGLALALVGAPLGFLLSVRSVLSHRLQWAAIIVPLFIAAVYWLGWETRSDAARGLGLWLIVAAIGAAGTLVLADPRVKPTGTHKLILLLMALAWWTSWGLATVGASVPRHDDGAWAACASNLKQIGIARLQYEDEFGGPPGGLRELDKAGLLPERLRACPFGGAYREIGGRADPSDYVLMCSRHRPYVLLLRGDSAVLRFRQVTDRLGETR